MLRTQNCILQALLVSVSGWKSQTLNSYQSIEYILALFCQLDVVEWSNSCVPFCKHCLGLRKHVVEFHSHLFTEQLLKYFVNG